MRKLTFLVPCLLFAGCGLLDAGQVQAVTDVVNQLEASQAITMEQAEALRQAILTNTGEPWWMQLGKIALEVGLAVAGVRLWRGPSASAAERAARLAARKA
ncbi:MAG: hypothetical protein JSV65_09940 [Armatimonadota bacterium]|jgi:hypothetical protein|nr:MAG: hypothetical protein JSV65_09940 [Armatimonadota bacterium]